MSLLEADERTKRSAKADRGVSISEWCEWLDLSSQHQPNCRKA